MDVMSNSQTLKTPSAKVVHTGNANGQRTAKTDGTLTGLIRESPSNTAKPMDEESATNLDEQTGYKWPTEYESAGAILFSQDGLWLGKYDGGYADFCSKKGGPPQSSGNRNPWETAQRGVEE